MSAIAKLLYPNQHCVGSSVSWPGSEDVMPCVMEAFYSFALCLMCERSGRRTFFTLSAPRTINHRDKGNGNPPPDPQSTSRSKGVVVV